MSRIDSWTLIEKFDGAAHGLPPITLAGSPFEAIGQSEHLRTIWRALRANIIKASIYDVLGYMPESAVAAEVGHARVDTLPGGIRIFHLNGNDIEAALHKIDERQPGFFLKGTTSSRPRGSFHVIRLFGRNSSIASI